MPSLAWELFLHTKLLKWHVHKKRKSLTTINTFNKENLLKYEQLTRQKI